MTIIDQTIVGLLLHIHGPKPHRGAAAANAKVGTVLGATFTHLGEHPEAVPGPAPNGPHLCH